MYSLTEATEALWEVIALPELETLLPFPTADSSSIISSSSSSSSQDTNIVLITQYYRTTHESVQRDIDGALIKNLANPHIKEIYLLTEVQHLNFVYFVILVYFPIEKEIDKYVLSIILPTYILYETSTLLIISSIKSLLLTHLLNPSILIPLINPLYHHYR